jgi:hypothetical protein
MRTTEAARVTSRSERAAGRRVLVAGLARSGTTWTASALAHADGAGVVNEPDSPRTDAFGFRVASTLGFFPVVEPGDRAPEYERLWERAFVPEVTAGTARRIRADVARRMLRRAGRSAVDRAFDRSDGRLSTRLRMARELAVPRGPVSIVRRPVVKSVTSAFSLEWIAARWDPAIVIVLRHPFNVVASWLSLGVDPLGLESDPRIQREFARWCGVEAPPTERTRVGSVAWRIGLLTSVLQAKAAKREEWRLVTHEWLCDEPSERFRELSRGLDLAWTVDMERFLDENNRGGRGYQISRVAERQRDKWRRRLTEEQVREAGEVLARFPVEWSMFGGRPW